MTVAEYPHYTSSLLYNNLIKIPNSLPTGLTPYCSCLPAIYATAQEHAVFPQCEEQDSVMHTLTQGYLTPVHSPHWY